MILIRDDNLTRTFSFMTLGLIVINTLVFLQELQLPSNDQGGFDLGRQRLFFTTHPYHDGHHR
jgi:hypothetical protein